MRHSDAGRGLKGAERSIAPAPQGGRVPRGGAQARLGSAPGHSFNDAHKPETPASHMRQTIFPVMATLSAWCGHAFRSPSHTHRVIRPSRTARKTAPLPMATAQVSGPEGRTASGVFLRCRKTLRPFFGRLLRFYTSWLIKPSQFPNRALTTNFVTSSALVPENLYKICPIGDSGHETFGWLCIF